MSVGAVNKQTGERIPTAGMPAVDSVLSGSSTNPVQNRVVKAALDEKADTDIVASDFSAATSYTAGEYCIYGGKFYKFKANHSGAWSASDVDEIKIAGELSSLMSGLTSRLITVQTNIEGVDFVAFVSGVFNYANGLIGDNSSVLINAYWVGQNNYTAIVYKGNSNFMYAIIYCTPAIYQADYINGVTTSRQVQLVN